MSKYIILAQSRPTATALKVCLCLAEKKYRVGEKTSTDCIPEIIWEDSGVGLEAYRFLAGEIENAALGTGERLPVGEVVVLVDQVDLTRLNPMVSSGWDSVVAMLILTFPEIHWAFGVVQGVDDKKAEALVRDHGLLSIFATAADPLFDGTGLREWVHSLARGYHGDKDKETAKYLPKRIQVAVAIDDERSYAYFHTYAAYRFGFRAYVVTEESLMDHLLGEDGRLADPSDFRLSIEDLFLNFPDRSDKHRGTHWSDLVQRTEKLHALSQAGILRIFVTSGQRKGTSQDRHERNRTFRESLRLDGRMGTILYKPMSGIFDLWKNAGLMRKLQDGRQYGHADGFIWPPNYDDVTEIDLSHDHSAPGRLLEVATRLVVRAENLLQNVHGVIDAVQGAVLAVEAMELLGEKAQTTFLEALTLKQQFEAIAECQFYGVQSHFDVESRMEDIQLEVRELSRYFSPFKRKEAEWNAEAAILGCLIRAYREYDQFDEELVIQVRNRTLHRRLWFKEKMSMLGDELRWLNPFYWVASYVHFLLKSTSLFVLALVLWVCGLSILFTLTSPVSQSATLHHGIEDAVSSFFSVGGPIHHEDNNSNIPPAPSVQLPPIEQRLEQLESKVSIIHNKVTEERNPPAYVAVICLSILAGFIHIGVFISQLFLIVSRK